MTVKVVQEKVLKSPVIKYITDIKKQLNIELKQLGELEAKTVQERLVINGEKITISNFIGNLNDITDFIDKFNESAYGYLLLAKGIKGNKETLAQTDAKLWKWRTQDEVYDFSYGLKELQDREECSYCGSKNTERYKSLGDFWAKCNDCQEHWIYLVGSYGSRNLQNQAIKELRRKIRKCSEMSELLNDSKEPDKESLISINEAKKQAYEEIEIYLVGLI